MADTFHMSPRIKSLAGLEIGQRMKPLAIVYILLFSAGFWGSNLTPKDSPQAKMATLATLVLVAGLFILSHLMKNSQRDELLRKGMYVSILGLSLVWGALTAYAQYSIPLGWTTFILILISLFIASSQVVALVPDIRLLVTFEWLLMLPTIFVNLYFIGGLQGNMIGGFFGVAIAIYTFVGWFQNRQFWQARINYERLDAVFEAMPGQMGLVASDGKIVRINQKMSEVLEKDSAELVGQSAVSVESPLQEYFTETMDVAAKSVSRLIEKGRKKFYFKSEKYTKENDVIVLGLDMTDLHLVQEQLEFQRKQSHSSARFACLGEAMANLSEKLPYNDVQAKVIWQISQKIAHAHLQDPREVQIGDLFAELKDFFAKKAEEDRINFEIDSTADMKIVLYKDDLFLSLANLVNNSLQVLAGHDGERRVTLACKYDGDKIVLNVADTGPGIPEYLEDVIFEPNYTTRAASESTGLGLSLTKQLIEANNGKIKIESLATPTIFSLSFDRA